MLRVPPAKLRELQNVPRPSSGPSFKVSHDAARCVRFCVLLLLFSTTTLSACDQPIHRERSEATCERLYDLLTEEFGPPVEPESGTSTIVVDFSDRETGSRVRLIRDASSCQVSVDQQRAISHTP